MDDDMFKELQKILNDSFDRKLVYVNDEKDALTYEKVFGDLKVRNSCDGCYSYNKKSDSCKRVGSEGIIGICWMEHSEGEY